jgi:hypothetical protein
MRNEQDAQGRNRRMETIFIVSSAAVFLVIAGCAIYFVVQLIA